MMMMMMTTWLLAHLLTEQAASDAIHLHYDGDDDGGGDDDDRDDNYEIKQTGESINNTIRPICDQLQQFKVKTVQSKVTKQPAKNRRNFHFFPIPDKVTMISSSPKRPDMFCFSHILLLLRDIAATFPWGTVQYTPTYGRVSEWVDIYLHSPTRLHGVYGDNFTFYAILMFRSSNRRNGSVVCIVTAYGLDGLRIESRWMRDFPHLSRPTLRPTQLPVQWVPGLSRG